MTDRYEEALEVLQQAETLATEHNRVLALARIHGLRGNIYFPLGEVERCRAEHHAAYKFAKKADSKEEQARALGGLGDAYYVRGKYQTAYEHFDRCVNLSRKQCLQSIEIAYLPMRAVTGKFCLRVEQPLNDCDTAMRLASEMGPTRGAIISYEVRSHIYCERHEFAKAEEDSRRGIELSDKLGALRLVALFKKNLARIQLYRGDRAGALRLAEEGMEISRRTGVKFVGPVILGIIAAASDDPDSRRAALREGQAILNSGCVGHNYFWFYRDAIEVSLCEREWVAAEAYALALDKYFDAETPAWPAFTSARARALADFARQGPRDSVIERIRYLRDQAVRLRMKPELPALEAALAEMPTP